MTAAMWIGVAAFALLLVLIFARVPIGFAMIGAGFIGMWVLRDIGYAGSILGSEPFSQATNYTMTCMPMFCVMGSVICESGMGNKLYRWAKAFIGHIRGGLGMATVCACGVFAAICGNSQITAMTLGKISFPEMKDAGYNDSLAVGGIAAGGGIGIMIPPSVGFIVYGMITEQSIGKLFMCGLIPGIIQVVLFSLLYFVVATVKPSAAPASERAGWKERLSATKDIWSILVLLIIMLGGIYGGFFTATEAGAIGAIGAVLISLVTRSISVGTLWRAVVDGARVSATILIILVGAKVFLRFMTITNLTTYLTNIIINLNVNRYVVLFCVFLLYLVLGCVFDIMSGLMLTVPFLFPIMTGLGFDPLWFGVFVVAMMELGEITPPIGLTCFMISDACQVPVSTVYKGVIPFICVSFLFILIISAFPQLCLLLA